MTRVVVTNSEQLPDDHVPAMAASNAMFHRGFGLISLPGKAFSVFGFRNEASIKIIPANHGTT